MKEWGIKTGRLVSLALLLLPALLFGHDSRGGNAIITLYHDEGVWLDGLIATEHMLDWMGLNWREVNADELNEHGLSGFRVFWLPGGWAPDYLEKIHAPGREAILKLVRKGGAYVGVCAGAYYAAQIVVWEGESHPYPLGLFRGRVVGPEIFPWPRYGMVELELTEHPINIGTQEEWVLLYGGGHFEPAASQGQEQEVEVLARYKETGQPAAIAFSYGQGRVLLIGVHPEIEEDDTRDGTYFAQHLDDHGSDWPWMRAMLEWLLNMKEARWCFKISC